MLGLNSANKNLEKLTQCKELLQDTYSTLRETRRMKARLNLMIKFLVQFVEDCSKTAKFVIADLEKGIEQIASKGLESEGDFRQPDQTTTDMINGLEEYARDKKETINDLRYQVHQCLKLLEGVYWSYKHKGHLFNTLRVPSRDVFEPPRFNIDQD